MQIEKQCDQCAENPELARIPKIGIPHSAMPNISVTLDVIKITVYVL